MAGAKTSGCIHRNKLCRHLAIDTVGDVCIVICVDLMMMMMFCRFAFVTVDENVNVVFRFDGSALTAVADIASATRQGSLLFVSSALETSA